MPLYPKPYWLWSQSWTGAILMKFEYWLWNSKFSLQVWDYESTKLTKTNWHICFYNFDKHSMPLSVQSPKHLVSYHLYNKQFQTDYTLECTLTGFPIRAYKNSACGCLLLTCTHIVGLFECIEGALPTFPTKHTILALTTPICWACERLGTFSTATTP